MRSTVTLIAIVAAFWLRCLAVENLVRNGGFEGVVSTGDWQTSGDFHADSRFRRGRDSEGYAYLSAYDGIPVNGLQGTIYQELSIPADTLSASFIFWNYITAQGTDNNDSLVVTVQSDSGSTLKRLTTLYAANHSTEYVQHPAIELSEFAGRTIRIHFEGNTDGTVPTVFRVDDVSLLVIRRNSDTIRPDILRFYPTESTYPEGDDVQLEYSVRDFGGSGLRLVTLSRSNSTDIENDPNWKVLEVRSIEDSGEGDLHIDTFTDRPSAGTYWYSITVEDNAGNRTKASDENLGPDRVRILPDDTDFPGVTNFHADAEEVSAGSAVTIHFEAFDETSGLASVELFSNTQSNRPLDDGWELKESLEYSGELEVSGQFVFNARAGEEWFDLRLTDRSGNVSWATEQAISPLRISGTRSEERVAISVRAVPEGWGNITLDPQPDADGMYKVGTAITATAFPKDGFAFRIWNGIVSTIVPTAHAVAKPGIIEAVFENIGPTPKPETTVAKPSGPEQSISVFLQTREAFCYLIRRAAALTEWEQLTHICGTGQIEEIKLPVSPEQSQEMLLIMSDVSTEAGLTLKLPLPAGRAWKLTTEVGDRAEATEANRAPSHLGTNYYSLDFDNSYYQNGNVVSDTDDAVKVLAAGSGVVFDVGYAPYEPNAVPPKRPERNGYFIVVRHNLEGDDSYYLTRYLHLAEVPKKGRGDPVAQGEWIGVLGNSGLVKDINDKKSKSHLHFGIQFKSAESESATGGKEVVEMGRVRLEDRGVADYHVDDPLFGSDEKGYFWSTNAEGK